MHGVNEFIQMHFPIIRPENVSDSMTPFQRLVILVQDFLSENES